MPGELNFMLAGRGITHRELSPTDSRELHGVQLWYALPESTRSSANGFAHYAQSPVALPGAVARVFIGSLAGSVSPVVTRTPDLLGAELVVDPDASVQLNVWPDFEHAILAESDPVLVNSVDIEHRSFAYVPPGSETLVTTAGSAGARVFRLGGITLKPCDVCVRGVA